MSNQKFIQIYEDIWQKLERPNEIAVYAALRRRVSPERPHWYSSMTKLAGEARMSVSTLRRTLTELEKRGIVEVTPQYVPDKWDKNDLGAISNRWTKETPNQVFNDFWVAIDGGDVSEQQDSSRVAVSR